MSDRPISPDYPSLYGALDTDPLKIARSEVIERESRTRLILEELRHIVRHRQGPHDYRALRLEGARRLLQHLEEIEALHEQIASLTGEGAS